MKKLFLTLEYPPQTGGIASFVYNLVSHLPAEDNFVWAPLTRGAEEFDLKSSIKTFRGRPYWPLVWPHWLRMFFSVYKICKKSAVDKIYLQHVLPVGYVAYLIKKFLKIPYAVFFHGTDLELAFHYKKNKLIFICNGAEEIFIHSDFMRAKAAAILGADIAKKFKIIYPCPADSFLQPRDNDRVTKIKTELGLQGRKVIISVGRVEDGKGFTRLINFLPSILKLVPNTVLLIVGEGPKRADLIKLTQKLNLQNVVRWLGEVPYGDLSDYYQAADLFVLLTHPDKNKEEAWGTVFLEAAAAGLPTVAGRAGGVAETVEDGITGWLVDSGDKDETVAAITRLLTDTELAKTMGAAGRERVQREFTWDKQAGSQSLEWHGG